MPKPYQEELNGYKAELDERVTENERALDVLQLKIIEITNKMTKEPSMATNIVNYEESEEEEEDEEEIQLNLPPSAEYQKQ